MAFCKDNLRNAIYRTDDEGKYLNWWLNNMSGKAKTQKDLLQQSGRSEKPA